jgi:predicted RNA binding protein YcfA (HicA-like mRNA interferase family)
MVKLPQLSGKELIKILNKIGFVEIRQNGSHVFLMKETIDGKLTTVVPLHKEIDIGTLKEILRQTKVNREDLERLK